MTITELVTDWKFWSVVVSFSALILSQLPPIHLLLRKAKLDLEVYSRIFITHKVGNPNLQMHLILRNVGGRLLRFKRINANLFRDNKKIMELPAQTFVSNPKDNFSVLLTSFDLKPGEERSYLTSFVKYFDRNEDKIYKEAEFNLKNEILRQKDELGEKHFAVASQNFVKPFNELFEKKFNWLPGDYTLEIAIETEKPNVNASKRYRFTVFESMTDDFLKHKEGFPSGAGIYWESPLYVGQWIEIEGKNG